MTWVRALMWRILTRTTGSESGMSMPDRSKDVPGREIRCCCAFVLDDANGTSRRSHEATAEMVAQQTTTQQILGRRAMMLTTRCCGARDSGRQAFHEPHPDSSGQSF